MGDNLNFEIVIVVDRRRYRLRVERIYADAAHERYHVSSSVSTMILQCNWPVFRKRGLKKRMPNWTLYEGKLNNRAIYDKTIKAIEAYLQPLFAKNPDF